MGKLLILILLSLSTYASSTSLKGFKKVSFIYVGPSKGLSESSFGHAALRLSPEETPGILDLVVEFVADIPQNEIAVKKYFKGVGIGGKYPMYTGISAFYDFMKLKTIVEDRPLDIYELNLTSEEITSVLDYINHFKNQVNEESYSFFKKNCAYFAVMALEKAIQKEIPSKSFPWKSPQRLQELKLVTNKLVYPAASSEKERYAKKYFAQFSDGGFADSSWINSFFEDLKSMDLSRRMTSYLKLLWVLQSDETTELHKKEVKKLFRYLVSLENETNSFVLKKMFENPEAKRVIYTKKISVEDYGFYPAVTSRVQYYLSSKNNKLTAFLRWPDSKTRERERLEITVDDFYLLQGSDIVTFENQKVGRFLQIERKKKLLSQRLEVSLDYDSDENTFQLFFYLDFSSAIHSPKRNYDEHKKLSHLAINNVTDFKGEIGSCYSMTLIQKAFLERAIFVPEVTSQKPLNHLEILKQLDAGNYVVIPGYSSIHEFTKEMNKEELKKFIRSKQATLNRGVLAQVIENITTREEINKKNIQKLKNLTDEGIYFPMIIGMTYKNSKRVASPLAHAVLILDIETLENGTYKITTYDPNTNINSLFTLDKNFKLHYPFYDKNYDYLGVLDSLNEFEIQLDHAVRSREIDSRKISTLLKGEKPIIVSPQMITTILD